MTASATPNSTPHVPDEQIDVPDGLSPDDSLAIVGTGPTALYLMFHLLQSALDGNRLIRSIDAFERGEQIGLGMPYNPATTDHHNLCNISSEELPTLPETFADWLREQPVQQRQKWGVDERHITDDETYSRIAMGRYFQTQWFRIADQLSDAGITVRHHAQTSVDDIATRDDGVTLHCTSSDAGASDRSTRAMDFDRVVIATGHHWSDPDDPENGFYASPWPIQKLLPDDSDHSNDHGYNFTIGTLGASLSAFDVIASLSHRHGNYIDHGSRYEFKPDPQTPNFRVVMHAAHGWLPHLQYEQREPFREMYRHVDRETLQSLRTPSGHLRLETYFDHVCRPALIDALASDGRQDWVRRLREDRYSLDQFVETMIAEHQCDDAFAQMEAELPAARLSVQTDRPIRWKEVFDDLMYTLNYHFDWLPAEDHERFADVVMNFLMNVIAALPLPSAKKLLALHQADRLDLISGYVQVDRCEDGETIVTVDDGEDTKQCRYRMFIQCGGQDSVTLQNYPFESLKRNKTVRQARVAYFDQPAARRELERLELESRDDEDQGGDRADMFEQGGVIYRRIPGIDVDAMYRVIGADGRPNHRIFELAFPHTLGWRPYSYGLQACNQTATILTRFWKESSKQTTLCRTALYA